jgi:hypothetical protein
MPMHMGHICEKLMHHKRRKRNLKKVGMLGDSSCAFKYAMYTYAVHIVRHFEVIMTANLFDHPLAQRQPAEVFLALA